MNTFKKIKAVHLMMALPLLALFSQASNATGFPEKGDATNGAKVWAENCTRCHNLRGPQELRDDQWVTTVFHMRVRGGLTGQDTRDIITFLQTANTTLPTSLRKSTSKNKSNAKAMTGEQIYKQTCFTCHGLDGKGAFGGMPDFTNANGRLAKSDKVLLKSITKGVQSPGSPMAMPAKGGNANLNEDDIKHVLDYIKASFKAK